MEKIKTLDVKTISFTAAAAIIGAGLAAGMGVSAYGGGEMGFQGNLDTEKREAMNTVLENGDYEAWTEIVSAQQAEALSEDRFNEMVQRHAENVAKHDAMEEILATNSFEAWSNYIADSDDWGREKLSEVVTEENFPTFVAMHEAMESGDLDLAKKLSDELGIRVPMHDGNEQGVGNQNRNHQGAGRGMGVGMRTGSSDE